MEEGCQTFKRLSYTVKLRREVVRCTEQKGNRKAAEIFEVYESNVPLCLKHKAAMSEYGASQNKFTGPKKGSFLEIDEAVFMFFKRDPRMGQIVLYCCYGTQSGSVILPKTSSVL
jgi:hypothetical protein